MKNILFPTDFSQTSRNTRTFLLEISKKSNSTIHVLNVFSVNIYDPNMPAELMMSAYQQAEESSKENLSLLRQELANDLGESSSIEIVTSSRQGLVVDEILSYVNENSIDMVVMGTTGASGILEKIIGSNAASIIEKCSKPVFAVPDKAVFKGFNHIVYATDLEEREHSEIKSVIAFAQIFNAELTLLHVCNKKQAALLNEKEQVFAEMKPDLDYFKVNLEMVENDNVIKGIDEYVSVHPADVIAMSTHRRSLLGKIFDRSLTRQMAYHTHIPMLALERDN